MKFQNIHQPNITHPYRFLLYLRRSQPQPSSLGTRHACPFNVKGDFRGDTSNGALDIDGIEGSAELRTSNGAIDVRNAVGEVDLQTSNGIISFEGELTAGGSNRMVTTNGRVDVELRGSPSISMDASTSNGEINITLPITTSLVEKNHIVGTIGGGEATLYIRTSNGDVTIR